ncbi:MAG: hypothetical protein N2378_05015 [Chloroflexaceae bacterium]|nr:hypothetical protein [Chloroflexaceae bacterium]
MAEQSWWRRLVAAVDREYERRIRAASLVTEYGASHHAEHEEEHAEEGEVAEIMNVPRGTAIGRERRAAPHPSGSEREEA